MKAIKSQSLCSKAVHGGRRHAAAKGAVLTEAAVIDEDQHDIRRPFRRLRRLRKLRGIGIGISPADASGKMEVRTGECGGSATLGVEARLGQKEWHGA